MLIRSAQEVENRKRESFGAPDHTATLLLALGPVRPVYVAILKW